MLDISADARFLAAAAPSGVVSVIETGLAVARGGSGTQASKSRQIITVEHHRGAGIAALRWRRDR